MEANVCDALAQQQLAVVHIHTASLTEGEHLRGDGGVGTAAAGKGVVDDAARANPVEETLRLGQKVLRFEAGEGRVV